MPSDAASHGTRTPDTPLTGRCYCGASTVTARCLPLTAAYCHCADCRRWTGAPVAAFAAFPEDAVTLSSEAALAATPQGVKRWFCSQCGSPLAASFDYLPGQIYVPIGVLDQAAALPPELHSHDTERLPWLHIDDDLERAEQSARATLNSAT